MQTKRSQCGSISKIQLWIHRIKVHFIIRLFMIRSSYWLCIIAVSCNYVSAGYKSYLHYTYPWKMNFPNCIPLPWKQFRTSIFFCLVNFWCCYFRFYSRKNWREFISHPSPFNRTDLFVLLCQHNLISPVFQTR